MAYEVKKRNNSWRLLLVTGSGSNRQYTFIKRQDYWRHGFKAEMTLEQARTTAKGLNFTKDPENREAARARGISRYEARQKIESVFLPDQVVKGFEDDVIRMKIGREDEERLEQSKIWVHWNVAKSVIAELKLAPEDWAAYQERFFTYFEKRKLSLSYMMKVFRLLNEWLKYNSRLTRTYLEPLDIPSPISKNRIARANKKKPSKASEALTPELLESKKEDLKEAQYKWLFCTVWLGLRPIEVDRFKDSTSWRLGTEQGFKVLYIQQRKLVALADEDQWKLIPLIYPEQERAVEYLKSNRLDRPLPKTLHRILGPRFGTYAGRKGFTDLMLSKGHSLELASSWMGHTSLDRTLRSYKNKTKVMLPKVA